MTDTRGIVHPRSAMEHFGLHRYRPPERLTPYVDRVWCVSWDLAPDEIFEQPILAHPCVNVVIEADRAAVYGVPTRLGQQRLTGTGWAVAAMFRPGGARPFLDSPAREWTDRVVDIAQHWGVAGADLVAAVRAVGGPAPTAEHARADLLTTFLLHCAPDAPPVDTVDAVAVAELVARDRQLCRVEDLAERSGIETRSMQRLFAEQVGLSPKQVIRRYRLLEAAEAAAHGTPVVWADVARNLGFSDQAHLTRDFTAAFGVSPARYAAGRP
jgi:AraC-like DNA-binding protein